MTEVHVRDADHAEVSDTLKTHETSPKNHIADGDISYLIETNP